MKKSFLPVGFASSFMLVAAFAAAPAPLPPPSLPPTATSKIPVGTVVPAKKAAAETAFRAWQKNDGAEFQGSLTFFDGTPRLMVTTTTEEPADKGLRRTRAIVSALDFLLGENAFPSAMISVVTIEPGALRGQKVAHCEVRREAYKAALKKSGAPANLKAVAGRKPRDHAVLANLSAELGLK